MQAVQTRLFSFPALFLPSRPLHLLPLTELPPAPSAAGGTGPRWAVTKGVWLAQAQRPLS